MRILLNRVFHDLSTIQEWQTANFALALLLELNYANEIFNIEMNAIITPDI